MDSNTSFEPITVPHPGETVQEYLDFYGWSQRDLARRTGLTPKTISEICNGKVTDHANDRAGVREGIPAARTPLAEPAAAI